LAEVSAAGALLFEVLLDCFLLLSVECESCELLSLAAGLELAAGELFFGLEGTAPGVPWAHVATESQAANGNAALDMILGLMLRIVHRSPRPVSRRLPEYE
jgi:hypothetical protein